MALLNARPPAAQPSAATPEAVIRQPAGIPPACLLYADTSVSDARTWMGTNVPTGD